MIELSCCNTWRIISVCLAITGLIISVCLAIMGLILLSMLNKKENALDMEKEK